MAEIVNLRLARKARTRAAKTQEAAANRAKHGQSGARKKLQRMEAERAERALDGAKLEGG